MRDELAYELDLLALGIGLVSALIASAWALLPSLVYLGPETGFLARHKPWFQLGGVGLLLAVGVVRAWRAKNGRWRDTDTAILTQGGVTLLVGVVLFTQIVAPVAADVTSASASTTPTDNSEAVAHDSDTPLKVVHLNIEGMSCGGCANTISTHLEDQPGVKAVDITFSERGGTVVYNPGQTSAEEIANSEIFQSYYSAKIEKVEEYQERA